MSTPRPELVDPASYIAAITAKAEGRESLEVLAETPGLFAERLERLAEETLRARPFAGKWTPLEVFGHLVDAEFVYGYRSRTIYADDRPAIIGMDQDKWVDRFGHRDRDPQELLAEFADLRRINLRFWRTITDRDLDRCGLHSERGEESLRRLLPLLAGHDVWHLEQFDRYVAASGRA